MRIGDVIEAVALRRNVAYREYFDSIKFSRRINYHTTMDPMYEEYSAAQQKSRFFSKLACRLVFNCR